MNFNNNNKINMGEIANLHMFVLNHVTALQVNFASII